MRARTTEVGLLGERPSAHQNKVEMSSETLVINLNQLCVTCGEAFKHERVPITQHLMTDEPAVRFIDALRTHTKFAELSEAQCPEYACDACFYRANLLVHFLRQCDRSAQFIKECITRRQRVKAEDVKHDDSNVSLLIDQLIADASNSDDSRTHNIDQATYDEDIKREQLTLDVGVEAESGRDATHKDSTRKRKYRGRPVEAPSFACGVCGARFKCRADRRRHSIVHSEGRFECRDCGRKFRQQAQLRTHGLTHAGERPFSCDTCPRRFFSKQNLQQHQVVHAEGKPFACHLCGKRFKRHVSLSGHLVGACKAAKGIAGRS